MPNLRGASPVGRGKGGRSYAARTVSRDEPSRQDRGRSEIPSTNREDSNLGRRCRRIGREKMGPVSKIHGQITRAWSGNTRHKPQWAVQDLRVIPSAIFTVLQARVTVVVWSASPSGVIA